MTEQQFADKLAALDLTAIMARVELETGLDKEDLVKAEDLYRKFLALNYKYPERCLVPTKLIDAVWHMHLQDTRKYMADCDDLFGDYLHHQPGLPADKLAEGTQNTQVAYEQEFGINLMRLPVSHHEMASFGGCGA